MLDVRRLEILCAVARTGSLAGAARALSYSTPAVWQHMKRLEAEVGAPLLVPHARGMSLTASGRILVHHGERALRRLRQAEEDLAAVGRLEAGELRIGAFATAGSGLLPKPIATFRAAHPGVRVSLVECEPDAALAQLRHGDVDLAVVFSYGDLRSGDDGLELTHLLDDALHAILPTGHPLAAGTTVTRDQLVDEPVLEGSHRPVASAARADAVADERRTLVYRGGDFLTVQRLVAAGAGIALVPRLALGRLERGIVARPLSGDGEHRRIFAATRRTPAPDEATRRFLELLLDLV